MAGMSGIELLGQLKAVDPGIEVIMLTAYETIETARQALRYGACDYLNKPFDIGTMRTAVASAMERRSLSDEMRLNNMKLLELQTQLQNQKLQEEISKSRGEIYASIIHDINGPLTIISGFIQLINQRIADASRVEGEALEMVKDRLKRMTRQVTNCIEISQRYLSFMRQRSTETAHVRVNQVLKDLEELLRAHPEHGKTRSGSHFVAAGCHSANQRNRFDSDFAQPLHQRFSSFRRTSFRQSHRKNLFRHLRAFQNPAGDRRMRCSIAKASKMKGRFCCFPFRILVREFRRN